MHLSRSKRLPLVMVIKIVIVSINNASHVITTSSVYYCCLDIVANTALAGRDREREREIVEKYNA
jgi:hypothetical protein